MSELTYNPETGTFLRTGLRGPSARFNGETRGTRHLEWGYTLGYEGRSWPAHRLAFHLMGKTVPDHLLVVHKNGDKEDNRWCNLEVSTHKQARANPPPVDPKLTPVEITWNNIAKSWEVFSYDVPEGRRVGGLFKDKNEAIAAKRMAERGLL